MNAYHKVMRTYPVDRFQDKSVAVTKMAEKIVLDHFHYDNFDDPRPSLNKLSKLCKEYVDMAMSNIPGFKFTTIAVHVSYDELDEELRPGIIRAEITSMEFVISDDNKKYRFRTFNDGTLYSSSQSKKSEDIYTNEIHDSLRNCISHLNTMLERGCMHACTDLYESGLWFTDRLLYNGLLSWLRSTNSGIEIVNSVFVENCIQQIVQSEIDSNLEIECRLEQSGGENQAVPAFLPTIVRNKDDETITVFMPQRLSSGWGVAVITDEKNIAEKFVIDINLLSIGVNKLIEKIRKTRV